MALIKCSDCGKMISDKATMCIGCGRPMKEETTNQDKKVEYNNMNAIMENYQKELDRIIGKNEGQKIEIPLFGYYLF